MGFGRVFLGALLVGGGGVMLTEQLGFLPKGTGFSLLAYWPALLVAAGLVLLANAIKNAILGWAGVAIVLGGAAFGSWWIATHPRGGPAPPPTSIDLKTAGIETLTLDGASLFNSVRIESSTRDGRRLEIASRGTFGGRDNAYRWTKYRGAGVLEWPASDASTFGWLVGGNLWVRPPARTPVRLEGTSIFSTADLDLSHVRLERCTWEGYAASVRVTVGARVARGATLRLKGGLARATIRLPSDVPVRLEMSAPFNLTNLPDDFIEHARGRARWYERTYTSDGDGPPLRIIAEGWFLQLKVEREQSSAI